MKITGKWISSSIFWKKHVRLQSHIVNSHRTGTVRMYCIAHVMHEMSTAVHSIVVSVAVVVVV